MAWLAATRIPGVAAASSFYGGGVADAAGEQPKCPVIFHFGETDASIPKDHWDRIKAQHPKIPMHIYPAGHGFAATSAAPSTSPAPAWPASAPSTSSGSTSASAESIVFAMSAAPTWVEGAHANRLRRIPAGGGDGGEQRSLPPVLNNDRDSPRRKEDRRLLAGAGRFVDDIARAGAAHLGVVRSVHAHARVTRWISRGRAGGPACWRRGAPADLPGRRAHDLRGVGRHAQGPAVRDAHPGRRSRALRRRADRRRRGRGRLPARPTRSTRSPCDYEPLPALASAGGGGGVGRRACTTAGPTTPRCRWARRSATPSAAFARADVVVGGRFRHRAPGRRADRDARRDRVARRRDRRARRLGVHPEPVPPARRARERARAARPSRSACSCPTSAAASAPRATSIPDEILVAAAALRLGRPVKWSRGPARGLHGARPRPRAGARRAARRRARRRASSRSRRRSVADVGAYPAQGDGLTANTVNHMPGPYRVPAYRGSGTQRGDDEDAQRRVSRGRPARGRVRDGAADGPRRAPARPRSGRAAPAQPRAPRGDAVPPGLTYKDGVPVTYDPGDFPAAFERALTLLDYDGWRRRQKAQAAGPRRIGVGLACYAQGTGLGPYEGATVRVDPSGKVYVYIGVAAQGQGHATTLAQVAAGELGAAWDDVIVMAGDTERFPFGMGTGGSRVMANAGPAVAQRRARGASQGRARRRRAARVRARGRAHRGRPRVRGRRCPIARVPLGRLAHAAVKSKALRGTRRARRSTRAPTSIPTPSRGRSACRRPPSRWTWTPAPIAPARLRDRPRPRARHQSGDRRGPAPGRRRAGHRRRAARGDRLRRRRPAPDRQPDGLRAAARRRRYRRWRWRSTSTARSSTRWASRASARAAPSRGAAAIANAIEDAVADLGVTILEVPVTPARLWALLAAATPRRARAAGTGLAQMSTMLVDTGGCRRRAAAGAEPAATPSGSSWAPSSASASSARRRWSPSTPAATSVALLAWLAGGLVSLLGALCYAELASAYPQHRRRLPLPRARLRPAPRRSCSRGRG